MPSTTNIIFVVVGAAVGAVVIVFGPAYFSAGNKLEPRPLSFDDPAIAACEAVLKSELAQGTSYRRVKGHIEGATVILDYETKFAETVPNARQDECKFSYSTKNDVFVFEIPKLHDDCLTLDKDREYLRSGDLELGALISRKIDVCSRLINLIGDMKEKLERPLRGTGIYPIKSKDTRLATSAAMSADW